MNESLKFNLLALLALTLCISACKKDYEGIQSVDDRAIQTYITSNNLNFTKDSTGYYYNIIDQGTGEALQNSDSVFYSYSFKLLNGTVLNQTSDLAIPGTFLGYTNQFNIAGVAYNFTPIREVFSKLKRGGKATLIMPSNFAFGKNGLSAINVGSNENILVDLGLYTQSKRSEIDDLELNTFETKNSLTLTKDPSGARYTILSPGTGTVGISLNSTIVANYTARSLDGTIVDQNTSGTFTAVLSDLYKGWQLILPGKVTDGGKLRLVLPSSLAQGTPLDFDIEIVSVK
ncbi:FKBP-type peptidyl-prolyl cis-trans isomerase [Pedobacter sp. UYEF25]